MNITEREQARHRIQEELEARVGQGMAELQRTIEALKREVASCRQVEERLRERERDLREQLAELEAIYNTSPVGLCMVDAALRYVSVNQRLAEMNGLPVEAHRGRSIREIGPGSADQLEQTIRHVLDTGQPIVNVEMTGPAARAGDTKRTCLVSCHPLKPGGGSPVGVCIVVQDITAQKEVEEALRQSQRFRAEAEKLAATGRVAARIAHEINNPLAGIKNSFLLIKRAIPQDHPHYEFVGRIEREIDRIADIVRQMFDLHRSNQDVEQPICVADTIHDVVTMLQPLCNRHRVALEIDMPDKELVVRLPEGSLRQVLYNLLDNAIEASPPGGIVKIAVQQAEETLCIQILDRGRGIPQELRSRVFEPFFTTKDEGARGGLGLGLSICQGIIKALHGTIDIQSESGQGSTFCVRLPMHRKNPSPGEGPRGKDPAGG